jgi:hypothetical protein
MRADAAEWRKASPMKLEARRARRDPANVERPAILSEDR